MEGMKNGINGAQTEAEAHMSSHKVTCGRDKRYLTSKETKLSSEGFALAQSLSSWKMAKPVFEPRSIKSEITILRTSLAV